VSGERLEFDSPMPKDLREILDGLGEPEPSDQLAEPAG